MARRRTSDDTPSVLRRGVSATGRVVLGDQRRIGLWILPLMLIVTLAGAVIAAGVTVLVYSQRVDALREEVGGAATAADAAILQIEDLVQQFSADLGLSSDAEVDPDRASASQGPNAAGVFAVEANGRVGNAFSFFSDDATTFLVTSAEVVGSSRSIDVYLPSGIVSGQVLDTDDEWDLATVRIDVGRINPLPWRPPLQPVPPGARAFILGVAGPDAPVALLGTVVGVGAEALLLDAPISSYLRGAPLLDGSGAVIGIVSDDHSPYGQLSGDLRYMPPIRAVCLTLVSCAEQDLGGRPPIAPAPSLAPAPSSGRAPASTSAPTPTPAPAPPPEPAEPPAVPEATPSQQPTASESEQPTQPPAEGGGVQPPQPPGQGGTPAPEATG